MALYLCLDGGGTKTTAHIAWVNDHGSTEPRQAPVFAQGEAGPSNLTQNGPQVCIGALRSATEQGLNRLPLTSKTGLFHPDGSWRFDRVWAGVAGCARPPDFLLLRPLLETLFPGTQIVLTGDGELLTAPIYSTPYLDLITLISGTGSLALLWRRESPLDKVRQVAREGGWGFLLGDEGSGWSLGREGIKSVLTFTANGKELLPWHEEILKRFGVVEEPHRLLTALTTLDRDVPVNVADSSRKMRIAGCTKHVVQAAREGDMEAMRIVGKVAGEVVETLRPLVETQGGHQGGETMSGSGEGLRGTVLVVGGGLGGVDEFWNEVEDRMTARGWQWGMVKRVSEPAREGLQVVLDREAWSRLISR